MSLLLPNAPLTKVFIFTTTALSLLGRKGNGMVLLVVSLLLLASSKQLERSMGESITDPKALS